MVRRPPDPRRTEASLSLAQSFITTDFSSDLFGEAALSLEVTSLHLPPSRSEPRLTKREKDIMSLPWTGAYAAAAKTGTLSNAELPPLESARPLNLAAALGLSPMPAVNPLPPPIVIPRLYDATQLISADPTLAEHVAAAEAVEVAVAEERHGGEAADEERDAVVLPTAHEVASSVVSTLGERFDRYRQALLTNQVGKARLRHVDSNSLLGANVHDFDDLRALSAHLRGLVGEAERRHATSEALRWRLELSEELCEELCEEAWHQAEEAALDHAEQRALHAAALHGAAHSPPSPTTRAARGRRPHSAPRPRLAATPPALLPLELGEAGPPTAPAGRSVGRSVRAQRTATFGAESAFGRRLNYSPPPMAWARVSRATSETPPLVESRALDPPLRPAALALLFLPPAPCGPCTRAASPARPSPSPPAWLHRRHSSTRSCSLGHRASGRWRCSSCPRASPGTTYGMAATALRTLRSRLCRNTPSRPLARPSGHHRRPPSSPESRAPTALSGAASRPRRCSSAGRRCPRCPRCPSRRRRTRRCRRSAASARRAPWSTLASRSSRRAALQACMCT